MSYAGAGRLRPYHLLALSIINDECFWVMKKRANKLMKDYYLGEIDDVKIVTDPEFDLGKILESL